MLKDFNVWEGVYESFSKSPSCGKGYDSNKWIESSYKKMKESLSKLNKNEFTNSSIAFNSSPLFIISSLLYAKKKKLKILDFGGGMGISFVELISVLPESKNLSFTIIDNKKTCEKANNLFKKDSRIEFKDELLPRDKYDIVHISSSLQYIKDWKILIKLLCTEYNAEYFIFNDLPAGNIKKTYATIQNYYSSKIPYWFFKTEDILNEMNKHNYKLIFKSNFLNNILNKYEYMPQMNFEVDYRIGYAKNLIFKSKIS
ncbi:methyltransferase, TIGR04325 family [Arcobacter sp. HD9-500m-PIT-SAG03]|nr:methyltransferase, TIGR04325 family [Arcobacter sp. HD9-500m-PIT-SAG03]